MSSTFKTKVVPVIVSALGSFILSSVSLQSPITTFYSENITPAEKVAAGISITSIVAHFFATVLLYIAESPIQTLQLPPLPPISPVPHQLSNERAASLV